MCKVVHQIVVRTGRVHVGVKDSSGTVCTSPAANSSRCPVAQWRCSRTYELLGGLLGFLLAAYANGLLPTVDPAF